MTKSRAHRQVDSFKGAPGHKASHVVVGTPAVDSRGMRREMVRKQILDSAIALFNARGVSEVPVHTIAHLAGMSLGNLQYHYKSKKDIIRAILPRLENEVSAALKIPSSGFTPDFAAGHQLTALKALWLYRFFFNALPDLLAADPALRESYDHFNERVLKDLRVAFNALIRQGTMKKIEKPNSTALIAGNLWVCLIGWLKFEQIVNPSLEIPREEVFIESARRNLSLLQPYFPSGFFSVMLAALRRRLAADRHRESKTSSPADTRYRPKLGRRRKRVAQSRRVAR